MLLLDEIINIARQVQPCSVAGERSGTTKKTPDCKVDGSHPHDIIDDSSGAGECPASSELQRKIFQLRIILYLPFMLPIPCTFSQTGHREIKNSIGNGEAKEQICMTHAHALRRVGEC